VPHLQVRVVQRSLAADTLGRIEAEHLLQEVNCQRVGVRVECRERYTRLDGERTDIVLSLNDYGELSTSASLANVRRVPLEIRRVGGCPQRACRDNEGFG
jgi:AmiR/NasT family two-component response regulator